MPATKYPPWTFEAPDLALVELVAPGAAVEVEEEDAGDDVVAGLLAVVLADDAVLVGREAPLPVPPPRSVKGSSGTVVPRFLHPLMTAEEKWKRVLEGDNTTKTAYHRGRLGRMGARPQCSRCC